MAQGELFCNPHGIPVQFLVVIVDITENKKLEEQLHSTKWMASLGRIAAGLAHEINNPLASCTINLQDINRKLQGGPPQPELAKHFTMIEINLQRSAKIASQVLIHASHGNIHEDDVDLNEVFDSVLLAVDSRMQRIEVYENMQEIPSVRGSFGKLEQVCINLVNNSIDAMPDGGSLFITTHHDDKQVFLQIRDTGTGMEKNILSKAIEPFFTTKEVGKGTGLGLWVCHGIITQHEGTLELNSNHGEGTKATIRLPISKGEAE
jgi:two-component system, NtrC family, sensor kinase